MIEFKQIVNRNSGFSLIEMMVVVAIIGVMATIAVPNMNLMSERAHQSEAKAAMAAIYATEKSFYGEFGFYTYCLNEVGYVPDDPVRYYTVGFLNGEGCGLGHMCEYTAAHLQCDWTTVSWSGSWRNPATFSANRWANPALVGAGLPARYDIPSDYSFKAVAFGSINGAAQIYDVWSIDDKQNRVNEQPGL